MLSSEQWPAGTCSKCGKANALAILTDRLFGSEFLATFVLAVVFFAFLIVCLVEDFSPSVRLFAFILAGVFSGPWLLLIVASIVKGIMPASVDLGPVGAFNAGIAGDVGIDAAREFKKRPFWYRFIRVYLWLLANGVVALFIIAIGVGFIYVVTNLARH
jgi:hypothetical protein